MEQIEGVNGAVSMKKKSNWHFNATNTSLSLLRIILF